MKSIASIHNCFGCGVCALVCHKKIINIELNSDGFYEPKILDVAKCTKCGLCLKVCSFANEGLATENHELYSFAAWSNNKDIRKKCSSGGIGFEIGLNLLDVGYKVCGVRYNVEKKIAEHYIASTKKELIGTIGSKYIQSYTIDGFREIDRSKKYLVTGTPCQIDSIRRYIRLFNCDDNFVLMDFFCHSVPSMLAWNKYIKIVEKKIGEISYVSWRNKFTGWHDSWSISIDGKSTLNDNISSYADLIQERKGEYNSRLSQGDLFYKLFLGDFCCNPACINKCKYKYSASSADIRIGDLWGEAFSSNEDGVSALVIFTEKGKHVVDSLEDVTVISMPFDTVAEGQMTENAGRAYLYGLAKIMLKSTINYPIWLWYFVIYLEKLLQKSKNALKKIQKKL